MLIKQNEKQIYLNYFQIFSICLFYFVFHLGTSTEALTSPYAPTLNPLTNGAYAAAAAATAPLTTSALQAAAAGVAGKQIEG